MKFECISLNGFAGDRTEEAMLACHTFAASFASHFNLECTFIGEPEAARDLLWDLALVESRETFENAAEHLKRVFDVGNSPILITPRCATAIASLPVVISKYPEVLVLYFDAHGDLNTPSTSDSGYLGGMPIAAALGEWNSGYGSGLLTKNLVHIGGRDIDSKEQSFMEINNIVTLAKCQIENDLADFKKMISGRHIYIHLDTDVYDPSEVVAEYSVPDGLFRHHVKKIVDAVLSEGRLVGIEVTELSARNKFDKKQSYDALFESFSGLLQD